MKETVYLNNDVEMPTLGLGLYQLLGDSSVQKAIDAAVAAGYRLFDTASVYKNEESVGKALARCGVPRRDLFITTKAWNTAQRIGDIHGAFSRSLERLRTDYVDLYLIQWPVPGCYLGTWDEFAQILDSGRARAIGVSNFDIHHLEELKRSSGIVPAVNQIELHPYWNRKELIEYCKANGIQVQAYSPLARGAYLDNDIVCVLGTKYARTTAQIGLRWALQKGAAVIPKSANPQRIRSNAKIFDFEIEEEDMVFLDSLNQNYRSADIPEDMRDTIH